MDNRPISAVQVIPRDSESAFMELRTRHAPVPQERSIIPVRPTTEDFSERQACVTGTVSSFLVYSCHGISIWFGLIFTADISILLSIKIEQMGGHPLIYTKNVY